jgi:indole-3-glycerol phosphate synthase
MSVDVLTDIVATTRDTVAARRGYLPIEELVATAQARTDYRPFLEVLAGPGLSVIAEHKRSSPSAGVIREDLELVDVVGAYERGGAAALSVLTEQTRFAGTLADLFAARTAASLPILRKDFIVDEYQLYEAAASGADAILLIVAAMEPGPLANLHSGADAILLIVAAVEVGPLANLHALAHGLGLATLVEVHNAEELRVATEIGAQIIGINNRNLSTLVVDIETTHQLLPQIPVGVVKVAESGFRTRAELERLAAAGIDAVLIGEALMRSADIEAACRELTGV